MTNAETVAKIGVFGDVLVEFGNDIDDVLEEWAVLIIDISSEIVILKSGLELFETETTTQGVVEHSDAAVGGVHSADDVEIAGNGKQFIIIGKSNIFVAIILFNGHEEFTENLAEIAAVDFVDDEKI